MYINFVLRDREWINMCFMHAVLMAQRGYPIDAYNADSKKEYPCGYCLGVEHMHNEPHIEFKKDGTFK